MRAAMVKKYFQKTNLLLNKLLQLNKAVQNCTIEKLVGHNLVQHMCSIGNYRLIRPKHTPHVAPIYEPNPLKSWISSTYWSITCPRMDNSRMLYYGKN